MVALLPTLTHARIRAMQGDVDGARAIVREILSARPGDDAALALLEEIESRPARGRSERVLALEGWLERIRRVRERERAR